MIKYLYLTLILLGCHAHAATAAEPVDSTEVMSTQKKTDKAPGKSGNEEKTSKPKKECHQCKDTTNTCICESPLNFCGYRFQYNPATNCHKLDIGKGCCGSNNTLRCYEKRCNSRNLNVRIGEPLMIEVMGMNPLKYDIIIDGIQQSNEQNPGQLISTIQSILTPEFGPFPVFGNFAATPCTADKKSLKSYTEDYSRQAKIINDEFNAMQLLFKDLSNTETGCSFQVELSRLKAYRSDLFSLLDKLKDSLKEESSQIQKLTDPKSGKMLTDCKDDEESLKLAQKTFDQITASDKSLASIKAKIDSMKLDLIFPYVRYVIPQVAKNTDYIDVGFSIHPKNGNGTSNTGGYMADPKHKYTIATWGGINFSFGTGLVMTGFANPTYQLIADSTYTVGSGGKDSIGTRGTRLMRTSNKTQWGTPNIGISAQAFFTYRCRNFFYPGATIGAAFGSDKNASVLIGGALLWGKTVKVGLSGGLALSTLRVPTGIYTIADTKGSQSVEYVNYKSGDVEYMYTFRANWFLSLTLNFGSFTKPNSNNNSTNPPANQISPSPNPKTNQ